MQSPGNAIQADRSVEISYTMLQFRERFVMPNGTVGDHPLTDILFHKIEVYGREADDLIRKIATLCSRRELEEWWGREIAWSHDTDFVLRKAKSRAEELLLRAKESGWEIQE